MILVASRRAPSAYVAAQADARIFGRCDNASISIEDVAARPRRRRGITGTPSVERKINVLGCHERRHRARIFDQRGLQSVQVLITGKIGGCRGEVSKRSPHPMAHS
jgi:hypothetical protein